MGSKKNSGKLNKILKRIGKTIAVLIALMLLVGLGLFIKYKPRLDAIIESGDSVVSKVTDESFKSREATAIYDRNGEIITEIQDHEYVYIPLSEMGTNIRDSFIAVEDIRFYEHDGVDFKALARAAFELVKNRGTITQGGSTITQQLVKNVFLTHKQTYERKLEEMYIARKLEKLYTKDQILEFYLNNAYFGRGAHGVEAAARKYFNKSAKDLTVSESAVLTGLTNNPTYYDPLENPENAKAKRDAIVSKMLEAGFISQAEHDEVISSEIELDMSREFNQDFGLDSSPVSFALWGATKALMKEEGFEFKYWFETQEERDSYDEAYNNLYGQINSKLRNGGYKIYSTIDMGKQEKLQESVNNGLSAQQVRDDETGLYKVQGSAVTIDNKTGDVLAVVGGRTQDDAENMFNRAILGHRQPGSTIKPVLTYTPAFEKGRLPSMAMKDEEIDGGPQNADRRFRGIVTLREAVERSYNTIPFKITQEYGTIELIKYLEKMEFSKLAPDDRFPGISVGGFTYGATALEMASAYSTIARNGEFISPTGVELIKNLSDEVIYENKRERVRVYDSGSAYLMTDVLKGVVYNPGATAYGTYVSNMATAGKTGTTNENKDAWFAGYTPYYTTVVWVGSDIPRPLYQGSNYTKRIWDNYMEDIHSGLSYSNFERPERISNMYVNPSNFRVSKSRVAGWRLELVPEIYYELQESGELAGILRNQEVYSGPSPKEEEEEKEEEKTEEELEEEKEEEEKEEDAETPPEEEKPDTDENGNAIPPNPTPNPNPEPNPNPDPTPPPNPTPTPDPGDGGEGGNGGSSGNTEGGDGSLEPSP